MLKMQHSCKKNYKNNVIFNYVIFKYELILLIATAMKIIILFHHFLHLNLNTNH